jgi:hypothetical protein
MASWAGISDERRLQALALLAWSDSMEGRLEMKDASTLKPGDSFYKEGVRTTVLQEREQTTDRFGQELFRYWCRRWDTHVEGWCTFGPGGVVRTSP